VNLFYVCVPPPPPIKRRGGGKTKRKSYVKNEMINKLSLNIIVTNLKTKESLEFPSITNAVSYFKNLNVFFDRNKISKCIKTGEEYKGYTFSLKNIY
jgi:hypothetical protein